MKRALTGFSHRFAYAALISVVVWNIAVLPLGVQNSPTVPTLVRIFDFPIAIGGRLLPCDQRGLDIFPDSCPPVAQEGFLFRTVRLGIPIYMMLFYLPNLLLAARRRWRGRSAKVASTIALFVLTCSATSPLSAGRGPSTPEERQQAVRLVRVLEEDPLNKDARSARQWLVAWLTEIPDISVQMCPALFGENFEVNKKYAAELALQQSLSGAAFMIEHPDQVADRLAVALAGVEGALEAYESLLVAKPKARFASLDALLEARRQGRLRELVATSMKACS